MTDSHLGPGWHRAPDGLLCRKAARVLLVDAEDRLLLVRGHDVDEPARTWWFTLGGGIDAGEDARHAAVREVAEETGLNLDPGALLGPVWTRSALFDFQRVHVRQDEEFYLARIDAPQPIDTTGWTDIERRFMDEARWWDLDALAALDIEVFPDGLAHLTRDLLDGWDGVVRHLGLDDDLSVEADDGAAEPRA